MEVCVKLIKFNKVSAFYQLEREPSALFLLHCKMDLRLYLVQCSHHMGRNEAD